MLRLVTPTKLVLEGYESRRQELKMVLTYHDKKVDHEINRIKNSAWEIRRLTEELGGEEAFMDYMKELKAKRMQTLLFEDPDGTLWTYSGLATRLANHCHDQISREFEYPDEKLVPWENVPDKKARPYQEEAHDKLLEARHGGVEIGCHRRGEQVLMFDGSLKSVEAVVVGDRLMGPDSRPRTVQDLRRGRDTMYRLTTVNGQSMTVNGHHILSLRRTNRSSKEPSDGKRRRRDYRGKNPVVTVTVEDYIKSSQKFKHLYKAYSVAVDFEEKKTEVDPYLMGLLLGDGSVQTTPMVTTADTEIVDELYRQAESWGLSVSEREKVGRSNKAKTYALVRRVGGEQENRLTGALRAAGIWGVECGDKFIPDDFKINGRKQRLAILAGLLDSDGHLADGCFDFVSKSKRLAGDVAFVARSLGMRATIQSCEKGCQTGAVGTYWRVTLSGDFSELPVLLPRKQAAPRKQKRDVTSFGFKVEKLSDDEEYFGFVLDSDHLYLTDSFLVTHNTGLGKSFIIQLLTKSLGLQAVIMAPSKSIALQLHAEIAHHFGKKRVGLYGDGKKDFKKLITVAIGKSLTGIEPGTPAWEALSKAKVFIADESHQTPATTLQKVCFGLVANAPYRFFFSGTQIRNDGLDLVLEAITGPIVYRMTVREGVDGGYLAKPLFTVFQVESDNEYWSRDSNALTRAHGFYNPEVIRLAADIANKSVSISGRPVLILIEEMEQFAHLLPLLRYECRFAHGGVTKENAVKVPAGYHDSDPNAFVKEFNEGKVKVLVGTSCVATGTDIKAAKHIIYLRFGASPIEVRQGVGRGTRLVDGKRDCYFTDFDVSNVEALHRHAQVRAALYEDIYGPVRYVKVK